VRICRFSKGKRRCSAAETDPAFAVGKYVYGAGGRGGVHIKWREIFALKRNQKQKYNKNLKNPPRRIFSFTFRKAEHIASVQADISCVSISRRRHIVRAEGAQNEGAKISP